MKKLMMLLTIGLALGAAEDPEKQEMRALISELRTLCGTLQRMIKVQVQAQMALERSSVERERVNSLRTALLADEREEQRSSYALNMNEEDLKELRAKEFEDPTVTPLIRALANSIELQKHDLQTTRLKMENRRSELRQAERGLQIVLDSIEKSLPATL